MANRAYNRRQALEKEVKDIYVKISFAAAGAPTLVAGASYGAASISRSTNGTYALTLSDKYNALKYADGCFLSSSAQDIRVQISSETVNSTKVVNFLTLTGATPTDPASGKVLILKLELKNTSVV